MTKDWFFFFFFGKPTFICGGFLCPSPLEDMTVHHFLFPFLCETGAPSSSGTQCHLANHLFDYLGVNLSHWAICSLTSDQAFSWTAGWESEQPPFQTCCLKERRQLCNQSQSTGILIFFYHDPEHSHELPLILEVDICIAPCEAETSLSCCCNQQITFPIESNIKHISQSSAFPDPLDPKFSGRAAHNSVMSFSRNISLGINTAKVEKCGGGRRGRSGRKRDERKARVNGI